MGNGESRAGYPVEPRTCSGVGSTARPGAQVPISMSTSIRPACSAGLVTVVSGGWQKSEPKMSFDGVQDVGDPPLRAGLVLRDRRVVQEQEHRW